MTTNNKCVAVLTRGYPTLDQYQDLIERNESINKNLKDKTIPILIFHEGNIEETHQTHISSKTPELNIQYIDIKKDQKAFRLEKESIPFDPETAAFSIGYRHMCSFWIMDFWHFVSEYDFLLRIDEDCVIDFEIDPVFQQLQEENIQLITSHWGNDSTLVTKGMNYFSIYFLSNIYRLSETQIYQIPQRMQASGPCCVFGLNLKILRTNRLLLPFLTELEKTNRIYSHRWGDGPLWGEIIGYLLDDNNSLTPCYKLDTNIRYFHKSLQQSITPEK